MDFSTRLKELRKSKKLNQTETGKIAGITSKQIQRYETNESEPTLSVLVSLADYFDVSLDYLVGRSNSPKRSD
jgi:transcriptional regulator with XRE-family HTH domain